MELLESVTAKSREKPALAQESGTAKRASLRNSLLLTDFSPNAEQALPYAAALAQQ